TFNIKQNGSNTIELESSLTLLYDGGLPVNLSHAPFPNGTVNFNGIILVPREKFIDDEPFTEPIQAGGSDILGVALDNINSLGDITVTIDGQQASLKSKLDDYVAFQLPAGLSPGVKNIL